jgi:hypothetical protein
VDRPRDGRKSLTRRRNRRKRVDMLKEMMKDILRKLKRVYEGVHAARYGPGHFPRAILIGSLFFMGLR